MWLVKRGWQPQVGQSACQNVNVHTCIHIAISINAINANKHLFHRQILASNLSITMSFMAINVAPGLLDFAAIAAGNGGDRPLTNKPIGLRAQYNEEGSGSELMGNFVVVDTSRKKGSKVGKGPV
ncbi:MAG: hypothetical protein FRX48_07745 [Lasallia pustulata]|uniref:Uncharacterized protein n=1 Tax=Lasallia pustulata TaxID=136370 RepID=A0A5M8PHY7_9LECA|nr:MAG: hypothetical protein FRX48_07745 [Lasallia pustulata]